MKRILAIIIALLLVFSLAACGGDKQPNNDDPLNRDDPSTSQTQGGTNNPGDNTDNPNLDFGSIMAGGGATDTVWGKQDEATKQSIIDGGKESGYDISFGADGSMTVVDTNNGSAVVQNPDGTWTFKDNSGNQGQIGGNWPDNEFTKLIPNPGFEISMINTSDDEFMAAFSNVTIEQHNAYVEKLKSAGFTIDADTQTNVIYSYTASNADGYLVSLTSAFDTCTLTVTKPDAD